MMRHGLLLVVLASCVASEPVDPGAECEDADGDGVASHWCGGADCCDADPLVHPGQAAWFAEPSVCHDFDYDCSGAEELEVPGPQVVACIAWDDPLTTCVGAPGWAGFTPGCGVEAQFVAECAVSVGSCWALNEPRVQGCR